MPQKREDPKESEDWEADKERPTQHDQGDEDLRETKDWEKDKEGDTGDEDGKTYEG